MSKEEKSLQKILDQMDDLLDKALKEAGITDSEKEEVCSHCGVIHNHEYEKIIKTARLIMPHVENSVHKFIQESGKLRSSDLAGIFYFIASKFIIELKTADLSPENLIEFKQDALTMLGKSLISVSKDFPKIGLHIMPESAHVH